MWQSKTREMQGRRSLTMRYLLNMVISSFIGASIRLIGKFCTEFYKYHSSEMSVERGTGYSNTFSENVAKYVTELR